jgi:hypothetical protein
MIATPSRAVDPAPNAMHERARHDFMTAVALQLGLRAEDAEALAATQPFSSPRGLLCRLHVVQEDAQVRVRPEVLLPLSAQSLEGDEVLRLLAAQAVLVSHFDCWLTASEHGWLTLTSITALATPVEVSTALAIGNALAPGIVHTIAVGEAA